MTKEVHLSGGVDTKPVDQTAAYQRSLDKWAKRMGNRFRRAARGVHPRSCPICGYHGMFAAFGHPPRFDARCAKCASLERHRLFALFIERGDFFLPDHCVLHFAPEAQLALRIKDIVAKYETADLSEKRVVSHRVDIEDTGLEGGSYDRIICNHVLEHVDDAKALAEIFRLLKPGGRAILSTPVCEGWAETYENDTVTDAPARLVHFGQADHLRFYGRDFRDRIRAAGFELQEFTAVEPDVLTFGLMRGETLFIASKPANGA